MSRLSVRYEIDIPAIEANSKYNKTASSLGIYGELGGLYKITDAIYVGANVTHTRASVKIKQTVHQGDKAETTANGSTQIGLVVGYAF